MLLWSHAINLFFNHQPTLALTGQSQKLFASDHSLQKWLLFDLIFNKKRRLTYSLMLFSLRLVCLLAVTTATRQFAPTRPTPLRSIAAEQPRPSVAGWQYESKSDQMGGTTDKAILTATNVVQFPYPYAGGSRVSLVLRNRNGHTNAYLLTAKGLFTNSFQGGRAQLRFDGGQPVSYALTAAENGSGGTIFFDADQKLIRQIRASKTMTARVQCPGLSLDELRFTTAGLQWKH